MATFPSNVPFSNLLLRLNAKSTGEAWAVLTVTYLETEGFDKVRMYEEMMMTNTDNLESSLLTSNLLKICSGTSCTCRAVEVEFRPL